MSEWYSVEKNPFYVLDVPVDCHPTEIERAGQKWLSMLALELEEARRYRSPVGEHIRTAEHIRHAMATLRVPEKRLFCELWYLSMDLSRPSFLSSPSLPTPPRPEKTSKSNNLWQCAGFPGLQP